MNTIYEYYERVSDRYYTAREIGDDKTKKIRHLWNPMAKKAVIKGFEIFDFFIFCDKKYLQLHEGLTGACVISQIAMPTRELRRCKKDRFLEAAPAILRSKGGVAEINVLIINFLNDFDQTTSPRYRAIKV
jgi:hypothetical protein